MQHTRAQHDRRNCGKGRSKPPSHIQTVHTTPALFPTQILSRCILAHCAHQITVCSRDTLPPHLKLQQTAKRKNASPLAPLLTPYFKFISCCSLHTCTARCSQIISTREAPKKERKQRAFLILQRKFLARTELRSFHPHDSHECFTLECTVRIPGKELQDYNFINIILDHTTEIITVRHQLTVPA